MMALLFLITILAIAGAVYLGIKISQIRKQLIQTEILLNRWEKYSKKLKPKYERLVKYEGIADADDKAKEIRLIVDAELKEADQSAKTITSEATLNANLLRDEAIEHLNLTKTKAEDIIEEANKRAKEIAGSAYDAMENVKLYEKSVRAMKNIIKGYGDQYLVPSHSLLDDLAEELGHTEAGQNLKNAREQSKNILENNTSATCDYAESNRRETAINFVIDAFNGKVDSILSRVKSDNAGTLKQKIQDSFILVNLNGQAFRNARITERYLNARLDELKWAAIVQQIKIEEREEQRQIKEQMREEAKARREYERAMRDAEKEEIMLRKAMEEAQQHIEKATTEQKAKYEKQLQELKQKLEETEERNQRAKSMAQQTRRGYVYVISNIGSFGEDVYKIGLTRRLEPLDRVKELGDSSVPFEFDVHALITSDDAPTLENQLHKSFAMKQMNKVNYRKEFFRVSLKEIREETERMELTAKWTMTAAAREYRESLAIEKAIKDNPEAQEAWLNRQLKLDPALAKLSVGD